MTKADAAFQAYLLGAHEDWLTFNEWLESEGKTPDYRIGQAFVNHLQHYLSPADVSAVLAVRDPFYVDDLLPGFMDAALDKFRERYAHTD